MDSGAQGSRAVADALTVDERAVTSPARRAGRLLLAAAALLLAAAALACALPGPALAEEADDGSSSGGLTTTGPTPPWGVLPPESRRGALAGAGEVVLGGVPAYIWRDGCAPTSLGMILGYWDAHGYPALVPGDASTQTRWADQAIASHGSDGAPRHYEDYSLPRESGGLLRDRSEVPDGDEHEDDSAADFMHTSRSADGLAYGWTWIDRVGPAFVDFVGLRLAEASAASEDYSISDAESVTTLFSVLQSEIGAGRPMVFYVDCDGNGAIDHAVTAVGYRETSGYPEYACQDTWYGALRWEQFRAPAVGYRWGVGGATGFTLSGPATPADVTGPVAVVEDGHDGWSGSPATVSISVTDDRAGVDFVEADLDGSGWTTLDGLPAELEVTGQGVHTVRYRATDSAGNAGDAGQVTVRVDGEAPVTSARAASVRQGARVLLRYRVDDLTPQASVRLVVRTLSGRTRATLRPGRRATGALLTSPWRATLPRGVYRVWVYATDQAGNRQATPGSARLSIR